MAVYRGPDIVTSGLVLCLDAANSKSYPGSGTIWSDLSGNGYNGILTNGPTYNSSNGGIIVFDGTNDYCDIGNRSALSMGTGDFTFDFWVKISSIVSFGSIISASDTATVPHPNGSYQLSMNSNGTIAFLQGAGTICTSSSSIVLNSWINICLSRLSGTITMYFNTTSVASVSHTSDLNNYIYLMLGRNRANSIFLNLSLGSARIYKNKGLNTSEILQNYNATKGRFGL